MKSRRPRGSQRSYDPLCELVFVRSQDEYVWDDRGNRYLDMICGYSACNLGHAHPRITAAACQQLSKLTWAHGGESFERHELEQKLARLWDCDRSPGDSLKQHAKVWLTVSGARANEIAWKLAYANRPGAAVRLDLAYHGRSLATAYLSDTERSQAIGIGDSRNVCHTIPFPRHPRGSCGPILANASMNATTNATGAELCDECLDCLKQARQVIERSIPEASILFLEPAIGARGYYFAPALFMRRLVEIARENKLAIISDEIQMGLRRTGPLLMSRAQGWEPDLAVLGKSLGGGIAPIAAVVGQAQWIDAIAPGIESETFAAYPLACRVACETLDLLGDENLGTEVERKGELFRSLLTAGLPAEIAVDGAGLASCLNLENLNGNGVFQAAEVVRWLSERGVLVHLTGPKRNRIATIPSLLMPEASLRLGADRILQAIRTIAQP